ncbi:hypothetical protein [Streptomyces sp. NPDC005046]
MIIPRRTETCRVRVVAVHGDGHVLLVRRPDPDGAAGWVLPGCPVERGESSGAALERLLATLEVTAAGPDRPVWRRTEEVHRGGELVRRDEDVYLVLAAGERPTRDGELLCPPAELPLLAQMALEPCAGAAAPRPGGTR